MADQKLSPQGSPAKTPAAFQPTDLIQPRES
jgi:hypothetical protein